MTGATTPTFEGLIDLLVAGNEPTTGYSGSYTELGPDSSRRWRVWRLGKMGRIEEADSGRLHFTAGPQHFWRAGRHPVRDPDLYVRQGWQPVPPELEVLMYAYPEEYWNGWLREDIELVERTLNAIAYDGRPAWRFSAPWVKGGCPLITVDAELGLVAHAAAENGTTVFSWSDLRLEPGLTDAFFEPGPDTLPRGSWPPPVRR
ncbi:MULTISPECIES: hypothetical protein [Nocardioides]|uniref:DUF402 domain-containing protein n=1 Tax=Nocardioides vastitatis TaxID=2568655 RepID=A0ABW0ZNN4_9ACTN|nr:hypothetical protein [Nocardioides sp.]THI96163.1 hypothetical protein E7Z54_17390 [Nocardioides sp.]